MAQINPSIPLSVRPPQRQQGAIGRLSQLSQLKNVQQQGKIQGMQLGQMEATQGRADAVRKILSQGLDPEQTYRQLLSVEPSAAAKFQLNQVTQGAADFQVMGGVFASMIGKTQEERQAMGRSLGRMLEASGRWQLAQQILSYGWTDAEIDAGLALVRNAENTLKGNAPLKVGATERVFAEGGAGEELVSALPKERKFLGQARIVGPDGKPQNVVLMLEPDGAITREPTGQAAPVPRAQVPGTDVPYSPAVQAQRTERTPVPGTDTPYSPDVVSQKVEIAAAGAAARPPTAAESTALKFHSRMKNAMDNIATQQSFIENMGFVDQGRLRFAPNFLQSQEGQLLNQAQREFTEARLRKDSGAAIPPEEYENDKKTYFPQVGDTKATLQQKAQSRQVALDAMQREAGKAYSAAYPEGDSDSGGPGTGETREYQGATYRFDGKEWVRQ